MSFDLMRSAAQATARSAARAHKEGDHGAASGLAMIAFGIFMLPIPIIGIPLIVLGIRKLSS